MTFLQKTIKIIKLELWFILLLIKCLKYKKDCLSTKKSERLADTLDNIGDVYSNYDIC